MNLQCTVNPKCGIKIGIIGKVSQEIAAASSIAVLRSPQALIFDQNYLAYLEVLNRCDFAYPKLTWGESQGFDPGSASFNQTNRLTCRTTYRLP